MMRVGRRDASSAPRWFCNKRRAVSGPTPEAWAASRVERTIPVVRSAGQPSAETVVTCEVLLLGSSSSSSAAVGDLVTSFDPAKD